MAWIQTVDAADAIGVELDNFLELRRDFDESNG